MTISPLADLTLTQVAERLQSYGSSLEGEAEHAIHSLLQALESGLEGTLEPAYHLSALDPGMGKTLSVATFLRTWKAQGFMPRSSVFIGLSRLAEIPKYLESAGLSQEDVAIVTSDRDLNALGVPERQHGDAPILFTSQQMIERRTRDRTFAEAAEFHFMGKPRALRIWDESLTPAVPLTLRVDDLACVPAMIRHQAPDLAQRLQAFVSDLWSGKTRRHLTVPGDFPELTAAGAGGVKKDAVGSVDALGRLAGREAALIDNGTGDIHIAGSSPPLPSDFAPVVILDASGRVRTTYRVWEREADQLRRLPAAVKDYRNLRVHLWEHAAGKKALQKSGALEEIVQAVAELVTQDADPDWLIVSHLNAPLKDRLAEALKEGAVDNLHFLHWGDHHGTNAFAHCRNVVLVGQLTYDAPAYPALASACGVTPASRLEEAAGELKDGEYRHNILQALTRASVRASRAGLAGTCKAFVIASPGTKARDLIDQTFPGCSIDTWSPTGREASGKAGHLIAILEEARRQGGHQRITKKALRAALSLAAPSHLSRLLSHPKVDAYIAERAVDVQHGTIIVRGTTFEPYRGVGYDEGFVVATSGELP